jgi:TonB family protein
MCEQLKHSNKIVRNRIVINRRRDFSITPRRKNFQFTKGAVFVLILSCATILDSKAASHDVAAPPKLPHPSVTSAAIDAKGVAHLSTEYGEHPPWMDDVIHSVTPDYPYSSRAQRNEGTGQFRLILDLKTGAVTNVMVIRSTGFPGLDRSAIAAFRQWRWKPGRWKEIGLPYTFILMAR